MYEVYVTVSKVRGGFIIQLNGTSEVTTSLNKAMKLIREALSADSGPVESAE